MTACIGINEVDTQRIIELNETCACLPLSRSALDESIAMQNPISVLPELLQERGHLFAGTSVFLSEEDASSIIRQVEALEAASWSDLFREKNSAFAPTEMGNAQQGTKALMMGYDFHITPDGPRLIEINTNAGGAFLVAALQDAIGMPDTHLQRRLTETFIAEWRSARRSSAPKTIAIVDTDPKNQYLYPDMLLAQQWLEAVGIEALIVDPSILSVENGKLKAGALTIDMVYNRLTDFYFDDGDNSALKDAWLTNAAVISPAPSHHALHADKRNLALLSDQSLVAQMQLPKQQQDALRLIPPTEIVTAENAERLWAQRRRLFFKPAAGYGGRATYRGQTTNFRSPGGGFAPIIFASDLVC